MQITVLTAFGATLALMGSPVFASRCKPSSPHSPSVSSLPSPSSSGPSSPVSSPTSSPSISSSSVQLSVSPSISPSISSISVLLSASSSAAPSSSPSSSSPSSSSVSPPPSATSIDDLNVITNRYLATDGPGSVPGWRINNGGITSTNVFGTSTYCGTNPGDPKTCYFISTPSSTKADHNLYQDNVPVTPGQTYTIRVGYRVTVLTGTLPISFTINDEQLPDMQGYALLSPDTTVFDSWQYLTATYTAPATGSASFPDPNVIFFRIWENGAVTTASLMIQFSDVTMVPAN